MLWFLLILCVEGCFAMNNTQPRILIALMVENNADSLPYSLFYLQQLDFPKSQISVWIQCYPSNDGSEEIVRKWAGRVTDAYRQVHAFCDNGEELRELPDPGTLYHVIIHAALELHNDYVMFIGADNILEHSGVLHDLLAEHKPIISPLLSDQENILQMDRNFWTRQNFFTADLDYKHSILKSSNRGSHRVEGVHGTVLIDLQDEQACSMVKFRPRTNRDVAVTSRLDGPGVYVLTKHTYGCLPVMEPGEEELGKDFFSIIQDKQLQHFSYLGNLSYPEPSTIGFDEVYVVNLVRRPERKQRMESLLRSLGIKADFIEAVDGWTLTNETLEQLGVTIGFEPLTPGMIGCFLSHYNTWKHAYERNYSRVFIIEDDLLPRPHFVKKVQGLVAEADTVPGGWDLLYVYRGPDYEFPPQFPPQPEGTRWNDLGEPYVTENLVQPRNSLGTIAYILSATGLEKVMAGDPLKNITHVDVWLSILYGYTPGLPKELVAQYASRPRLRALATWPTLARPHLLWKDKGHLSDTSFNPFANSPPRPPPKKNNN